MKRVGIVGAGAIVEDAHLPTLRNLPDVEVAWISDLDEARARMVGRMYGVTAVGAREPEAHMADVDVCLLAVPLGARKPYLDLCARLEKAVYSEKPFATTRAEHEAYCARFAEHRLAAGFQRRYYQSVVTLKKVVASRMFGDLTSIEFHYGQYSLQSGGPKRYIADASLSGGGLIIESAIHGLDQILFATSADAVTVADAKAVVMMGLDFDTLTSAELRIGERRVPVTCEITRLRNVSQGFVFHFERAAVHCGLAPDASLRVLSQPDGRFALHDERDDAAHSVGEAFTAIWRAFLDGLDERRPNPSSAAASLLTTGWVEDIYRKIIRA